MGKNTKIIIVTAVVVLAAGLVFVLSGIFSDSDNLRDPVNSDNQSTVQNTGDNKTASDNNSGDDKSAGDDKKTDDDKKTEGETDVDQPEYDKDYNSGSYQDFSWEWNAETKKWLVKCSVDDFTRNFTLLESDCQWQCNDYPYEEVSADYRRVTNIVFYDSEHGFLVEKISGAMSSGYYNIFYTANGGADWSSTAVSLQYTDYIDSIYPIDQSSAAAISKPSAYSCSIISIIDAKAKEVTEVDWSASPIVEDIVGSSSYVRAVFNAVQGDYFNVSLFAKQSGATVEYICLFDKTTLLPVEVTDIIK